MQRVEYSKDLGNHGTIINGIITKIDVTASSKEIDAGETVSTYKINIGVDQSTFLAFVNTNLIGMIVSFLIADNDITLRFITPRFSMKKRRLDGITKSRPEFSLNAEITFDDYLFISRERHSGKFPMDITYTAIHNGSEVETLHKRRRFNTLDRTTQAVLACKRSEFIEFISIHTNRPASNADQAGKLVCRLCEIDSRSFLKTDKLAIKKWDKLYNDFQVWLLTGEVYLHCFSK